MSDDINKTIHGQSMKIFKCGGIRGHESPRAATPQGVYPVSVGQAKIQLTGHQRLISSSFPVKSGVQRTHDERVPLQIQLYCRKSSWYVYREKQRRYPDLSDEGYVLVEFIQCDMTLCSLCTNG